MIKTLLWPELRSDWCSPPARRVQAEAEASLERARQFD
jgi:hypothetical protein